VLLRLGAHKSNFHWLRRYGSRLLRFWRRDGGRLLWITNQRSWFWKFRRRNRSFWWLRRDNRAQLLRIQGNRRDRFW
jgi:hypothetical protein